MKSYVITHPEYGIFVNFALGLSFWSKLDPVGQDKVLVFSDIEVAKHYVKSIQVPVIVSRFDYVEIEHARLGEASLQELKNAGLGELIGHLGTGENLVGMKINI